MPYVAASDPKVSLRKKASAEEAALRSDCSCRQPEGESDLVNRLMLQRLSARMVRDAKAMNIITNIRPAELRCFLRASMAIRNSSCVIRLQRRQIN